MEKDDPIEFPIIGELDLHTFRPSEIGSLIPEVLKESREKGILSIRIVHGKGTGALREGVHAILKREPSVQKFALCDHTEGGWGATRVWLKPDG